MPGETRILRMASGVPACSAKSASKAAQTVRGIGWHSLYDDAADRVDFAPSVFHVGDVGAGNLYVFSLHIRRPDVLVKSFAHPFLQSVRLRDFGFAHRR